MNHKFLIRQLSKVNVGLEVDTMERAKRYIKTFTTIGLIFALLIVLPVILKYGIWPGVKASIIITIISILISAVVIIPIDYIMTRNLPPEALRLVQHRELQINGAFNQIFNQCQDILERSEFIKMLIPSKDKMNISVNTKRSLISNGENITLQFHILSQDMIKIDISSRPAVRLTKLDFGKNFRNVERVSKMISDAFEMKSGGTIK